MEGRIRGMNCAIGELGSCEYCSGNARPSHDL